MDSISEMIPYVKDHVKVREEEFGLMVFTNRTPVLTFNKYSALIWNEFDGKKKVSQIAEKINARFEGDIIKIIFDFVISCKKLDLIGYKDI